MIYYILFPYAAPDNGAAYEGVGPDKLRLSESNLLAHPPVVTPRHRAGSVKYYGDLGITRCLEYTPADFSIQLTSPSSSILAFTSLLGAPT